MTCWVCLHKVALFVSLLLFFSYLFVEFLEFVCVFVSLLSLLLFHLFVSFLWSFSLVFVCLLHLFANMIHLASFAWDWQHFMYQMKTIFLYAPCFLLHFTDVVKAFIKQVWDKNAMSYSSEWIHRRAFEKQTIEIIWWWMQKESLARGVGVLATQETEGGTPGLEARSGSSYPPEANASYQVQGRTTQRYKCFHILCNCYIQYKTLNDIFPVWYHDTHTYHHKTLNFFS